MKYSQVMVLDRGVAEITALISAEIRVNENGLFELSEFASDEVLRPAEIEIAKENLIDRARCFPEYGENDSPSFRFEDEED